MTYETEEPQGKLFHFPVERTMRARVDHPEFVLSVTDALHDAGHVERALGILSMSEGLMQALNEGQEMLDGDTSA